MLAILAPIISRFIQLAVSRQREYLADASSVELTRNPYGLERALAKIGGDQEVLEVANRGTQHMYFTNPIKKFEARSSGLMDTHPPILDRINRLRQLTGDPPLGSSESAGAGGARLAHPGRAAGAHAPTGGSNRERTADQVGRGSVAVSPQAMLLPLVLAQFICSYAASNMNVAITDIASDLGTTVSGVQLAITVFTLTMAALMIPGSKLSDIYGRKTCFTVGLTVYGVGALIAAAAPGLGLLVVGYSLLEGIGTALLIPPVYILATVFFADVTSRARAFGSISAAGGIGAAAGPLIGGLITTHHQLARVVRRRRRSWSARSSS